MQALTRLLESLVTRFRAWRCKRRWGPARQLEHQRVVGLPHS